MRAQHARVCEVTSTQHGIVQQHQLQPSLSWVRVMQLDICDCVMLQHPRRRRRGSVDFVSFPVHRLPFESLLALAGALHAVGLQEPARCAPTVIAPELPCMLELVYGAVRVHRASAVHPLLALNRQSLVHAC